MNRGTQTILTVLVLAPLFGAEPKAPVELGAKDVVISGRSALSTLPLAASSSEVTVTVRTIEIRSQEGVQIPAKAIQFPRAPVRITQGSLAEIEVLADPGLLNSAGTYVVGAVVEGRDARGQPFPAVNVSFKYVVPGISAKVEDGQPVRTTLTRPSPFARASGRTLLHLNSSPAEARLSGLTVFNSGLKKKNGGSSGAKIRDGVVVEHDRGVEVTLDVPPGIGEVTGVIRVSGTSLKQDIEAPITVDVKDWWPFPLLIVGLGYLLSYLVTRWTTTGKQQLLNEFNRSRILQAIHDLLAAQNTFQPSNFDRVTDLIEQSRQLALEGNVNGEKDKLQEAEKTLDEVRKQMQAPPAAVPAASFSVTRLPVTGRLGILKRIQRGDALITALGIVLTALVAFYIVWQKDSFSGLEDYLLAFLGAFGIDQSVKGVGPIISHLRGGA